MTVFRPHFLADSSARPTTQNLALKGRPRCARHFSLCVFSFRASCIRVVGWRPERRAGLKECRAAAKIHQNCELEARALYRLMHIPGSRGPRELFLATNNEISVKRRPKIPGRLPGHWLRSRNYFPLESPRGRPYLRGGSGSLDYRSRSNFRGKKGAFL